MANVGFQPSPLAFQADAFQSDTPDVGPTLLCRIDWDNDGDFADAIEAETGRVLDASWTRGRSADFGAEATGSATLLLDNVDDRYTPDRNWHDNPSFEGGTDGWSAAAIPSLTAAATSITRVPDAGVSGIWAGEAILTATVNSGVAYAIPYRFRSGVTYAASVWLRSISGTLSVRAGLASSGTPADIASSTADITTSWAQYTFTWTPSADRTDGVFFVRTTTAAAATVRIDACQVNPGAAANAYLEAPTRGQLVPGRPVHIYATYSATDYPQFYGFIERLTPNPDARTVTLTCYDPLRRYQETDVIVASQSFVARTARDFRREVLEDFERGTLNLVSNPEFATDTAGWDTAAFGGTLTRITTDGPSVAAGTTCGEVTTTTTTNAAITYLRGKVPYFFAGQVYRVSFYARAPGTVVDILASVRTSSGSTLASMTITPTASWVRYTLTWTQGANATASSTGSPFISFSTPTTTGTFRISAVSVTRGQALWPYSATGSGRYANWCGNGSFDAGALSGWYNGFRNYCTNPDFETDTSGWAITADAFHTAGTSITRTNVSGAALGSWYADIVAPVGGGAHFAITGTFLSGASYTVRLATRISGTATGAVTVGIGSQGTPTDVASLALDGTGGGVTWVAKTFTWTPSADRTDAHFWIKHNVASLTVNIDAIDIVDSDGARTRAYADANIALPFATRGTSSVAISTTAKFGSKSQAWTSLPVAGSGRVYGTEHLGGYFVAGRPYILSLWLRASDAMPYRVGIGGALTSTRNTWTSSNTTGTLTANTWTQVTVTWTPSEDIPDSTLSSEPFQGIVFVEQTDATSRTVYLDGVRVIPGTVADDWEMSHWSLDAEGDVYNSGSKLEGSALSALTTINDAALSRHYIVPTMTSPWYRYVSSSRDSLAAKAVAETYDDDLADMTAADIDRAAIVNIVPVYTSTGATFYYSDEASVARYGPRPTGSVGTGSLILTSTIADAVGPALVARYRDSRARPVIQVVNRWPSQLQRELDDLVLVTFSRLRITAAPYLILRLSTHVSEAGQRWDTTYTLEEKAS